MKLIKTSQGWVGPSSALEKMIELKHYLVKTNENQVQFDEKIQSQDGTHRSKYTVSSIWRTNNKLTG